MPDKGRALVVTRRIAANEVVLREEPVAWALEESQREERCTSCSRPYSEGTTLRACTGCGGAFRLCGACRKHAYCDDISDAFRAGRGLPSAAALLALGVAHATAIDKYHACIESLASLRVQDDANELGVFAGSSVQHLLHGAAGRVVRNAFMIDAPDGTSYARGLFLLCSMCNSDCSPNVSMEFTSSSPTEAVLRSLRDIEAGEELCMCYVNAFKPRSWRRMVLRRTWGFDCVCRRCARSMQPNGDERHLHGVRCTACGALLAEHDGERCSCGKDDPEARRIAVDRASALKGKAVSLMNQADLCLLEEREGFNNEAMRLLREALGLFRSVFSSLHQELLAVIMVLAEAERRCGRTAEHEKLREEINNVCEARKRWISGHPSEADSTASPALVLCKG